MKIEFNPSKQDIWILAVTFAIGVMIGVSLSAVAMFIFFGAAIGGYGSWVGLNKLNRWRTQRFLTKVRLALEHELRGGPAGAKNTVDWGEVRNRHTGHPAEDDSVDDKYAHGE